MRPLQRIARALLRLRGWRVLDVPERPHKAVVTAYPHTSNWDFPVAILAMFALGFTPRWVAKDTLFRFPFGGLMRALGGIAVNRRERTGFVAQMVAESERHDDFLLCIAPEGTRERTEGWKSGFYRIASAANLPLLLGVIDFERREVGFLTALLLSGDEGADMTTIADAYRGRVGHTPVNTSPVRLLN